MKTFAEAVAASFTNTDGYWSFRFGDGYELTLEPLIFDGQHYLCLYKNTDPLIEKIPVKPGKDG